MFETTVQEVDSSLWSWDCKHLLDWGFVFILLQSFLCCVFLFEKCEIVLILTNFTFWEWTLIRRLGHSLDRRLIQTKADSHTVTSRGQWTNRGSTLTEHLASVSLLGWLNKVGLLAKVLIALIRTNIILDDDWACTSVLHSEFALGGVAGVCGLTWTQVFLTLMGENIRFCNYYLIATLVLLLAHKLSHCDLGSSWGEKFCGYFEAWLDHCWLQLLDALNIWINVVVIASLTVRHSVGIIMG